MPTGTFSNNNHPLKSSMYFDKTTNVHFKIIGYLQNYSIPIMNYWATICKTAKHIAM